ncbi:MAG: hypothetical protein EBQ89_11575 [Alphaproteobacteria bacterium]|nr:hypothetical protein [Alphaproteobacteria bacterium]
MALLPSIQPAQIPVRIQFKYFFDRAGVASSISKVKRDGLYRSGSVVMRITRRLIKKFGMARPKLAVMKQNPTLTLGQLHNLPGTSKRTQEKIRERIFQIKFRPASVAPNPPHTHLGTLRNSITYAYDSGSESVVIGGFMPGIPRIVSLHEFGGRQTMQAWAWIPDHNGRNYRGIIGWWAVGRKPRLRPQRWQQMGSQWVRSFEYPKRPYMQPGLREAIRRNEIVRQFAKNARISGG